MASVTSQLIVTPATKINEQVVGGSVLSLASSQNWDPTEN